MSLSNPTSRRHLRVQVNEDPLTWALQSPTSASLITVRPLYIRTSHEDRIRQQESVHREIVRAVVARLKDCTTITDALICACHMFDTDVVGDYYTVQCLSRRLPMLWQLPLHPLSSLTFGCSSVVVWWLVRHNYMDAVLGILQRHAPSASDIIARNLAFHAQRQQQQHSLNVRDSDLPCVVHLSMGCIVSYELLQTLADNKTLHLYMPAMIRYGHFDAFIFSAVLSPDWLHDQDKVANVMLEWMRYVVELQQPQQLYIISDAMSVLKLRLLYGSLYDTRGVWRAVQRAFLHAGNWNAYFIQKQTTTVSVTPAI